MSALLIRTGGKWASTTRAGAVRYGGMSHPFGTPPASGEYVDESFPFPNPTLPNNDDGQRSNLGTVFSANTAGSWIGNRVFTPSVALIDITVLAVGGSPVAELARRTATAPAIGTWVDILFQTAVPVVPAASYLAVLSAVRYAAVGGAGMAWPYSTAHLATAATTPSRWAWGPIGTVPVNATTSGYLVSPIVRFPK